MIKNNLFLQNLNVTTFKSFKIYKLISLFLGEITKSNFSKNSKYLNHINERENSFLIFSKKHINS